MAIRKRIGALVPSTNTTAEGDYQLAAPAGVTECECGLPTRGSEQENTWIL